MIFTIAVLLFSSVTGRFSYDIWNDVPCQEFYQPENCDFDKLLKVTVDDFDRCAPALLPLDFRNYFLGAAGRRDTYKENKRAYRRIQIIPKVLRNVYRNQLKTRVLGEEVDFPIGLSPVALQKLAHPEGELATISALSDVKTVMILSSYSTTSIEEVAMKARGTRIQLWMQTYIFQNRSLTEEIVRRADRSHFKAIVLTADSNIQGTLTCHARRFQIPDHIKLVNLGPEYEDIVSAAATFDDIRWLKTITRLPIVVKGILSGEDARSAVQAGASAILVSNHGARQLDSDPATIDVVSNVVDALKVFYPPREVYMDGGIRSGVDAFKAIASGARMVFFGRPTIWGLTINGSEGVKQVLNLVKSEFNDTMLLSGYAQPSDIRRNSLIPMYRSHCTRGYVNEQ